MENAKIDLPVMDLDPIKIKLMDPKEGKGWSRDYADIIGQEYRKYLALSKKYPSVGVVPSISVDAFWHQHILDTKKYAEDCKNYFGYFLHHFPYFGMRGKEDAENLQKTWEFSNQLYELAFGKIPDVVAKSQCSSCGASSCGCSSCNSSSCGGDPARDEDSGNGFFIPINNILKTDQRPAFAL